MTAAPGLLAVTAVGADRPGIIARVTGVLLAHDGNIEDSSMTILCGQFAIMLLVSTPAAPDQLEAALGEATTDLGLVTSVRRVAPSQATAAPTHLLSVYGADRPGLVHGVATLLAERAINVTDLETRVLGGDADVYAMMFEVVLPPEQDPAELAEALRAATAEVEVSVHALDTATL